MSTTTTARIVQGTFNDYPALATLPRLVRKQRRLEATLQPLKEAEAEEKHVRAQIHELLVEAGIPKGDGVTCAGYDVDRNHRDGQSKVDPIRLRALLLAGGISEEFADAVIVEATDTGKDADFATVRPMKGSRVRRAA